MSLCTQSICVHKSRGEQFMEQNLDLGWFCTGWQYCKNNFGWLYVSIFWDWFFSCFQTQKNSNSFWNIVVSTIKSCIKKLKKSLKKYFKKSWTFEWIFNGLRNLFNFVLLYWRYLAAWLMYNDFEYTMTHFCYILIVAHFEAWAISIPRIKQAIVQLYKDDFEIPPPHHLDRQK